MKYSVYTFDGDTETCLGQNQSLEEAEQIVLLILRRAPYIYGLMPNRAGNIWYVEDKRSLPPTFAIVAWIEESEG